VLWYGDDAKAVSWKMLCSLSLQHADDLFDIFRASCVTVQNLNDILLYFRFRFNSIHKRSDFIDALFEISIHKVKSLLYNQQMIL
jgi:hypothetical protein